VGLSPTSITVGDFNGDGKLDLVVANSGSSNVSVLLGNGDGTFQTAVNYGAGAGAQSVASADFNGNSKLDLAVANGNSNNVSILLNNTKLPSSTSLSSSLNPSPSGQAVTFTATIAVSKGSPTGTVTFQDGTITLGTGTLSGGAATFTTSALAVGSHSIIAIYGGDTSFLASISAPVIQQVR
jgi:hypothetical protein